MSYPLSTTKLRSLTSHFLDSYLRCRILERVVRKRPRARGRVYARRSIVVPRVSPPMDLLFSSSLPLSPSPSPPPPQILARIAVRNPRISLMAFSASHPRRRRHSGGGSWVGGASSAKPRVLATFMASRDGTGLPEGFHGGIAVGSAVTVLLAVMNRVLYKLALVPMKHFPFFLAQITTFG